MLRPSSSRRHEPEPPSPEAKILNPQTLGLPEPLNLNADRTSLRLRISPSEGVGLVKVFASEILSHELNSPCWIWFRYVELEVEGLTARPINTEAIVGHCPYQ